MTKELLQQCLDALIESRGDVDLCYAGVKAARLSFRQERQLGFYEEQLVKHDAAIEGLKQALAQQEQPAQEPVAWYLSEDSNILGVEWSRQKPKYGRDWTPLYKTAPTQPALTLDKLIDMAVDANLGRRMRPIMWKAGDVFYTDASYRTDELEVFARAIEAHCRGGAKS